MKMLKNIYFPSRMVFLFLLLFGSSTTVISANLDSQILSEPETHQELIDIPPGEQVNEIFDFVLPFQKNLQVLKGSSGYAVNFEAHIAIHTATSLGYIKRSRYIFPALGVKEVIFPFHVFL